MVGSPHVIPEFLFNLAEGACLNLAWSLGVRMADKLNFLLSGPGLIGKQHARLIKSRSDCRLSAVVAPPSIQNQDFTSAAGANFYTNIDDAFENERIHAAIISSPNSLHFTQAMSCI